MSSLPYGDFLLLEGALDQIRAEEALHDNTVYAVGNGTIEPEDRKRVLSRWKHQAIAGLSDRPKERTLGSIFGGLPIAVREE